MREWRMSPLHSITLYFWPFFWKEYELSILLLFSQENNDVYIPKKNYIGFIK